MKALLEKYEIYESLVGKTDFCGRYALGVAAGLITPKKERMVLAATVTKVEINAILSFGHFLQFPSTAGCFSFQKHLLLLSRHLTVAPFLVSNTTFCL